MATATAIQDFSATLVHLLRVGLTPSPVSDPNRIALATPDDFASFADPAQPAVTVFLYRIAVDGTMRNLPRRLLSDGSTTRPLLPVDMGFLITAWARQTSDEHLLMGRIMQVLYDCAEIGAAGCGSCCGTCGPIPGDGVNVISTANRNFKGRMGNGSAFIYLASPASCAAAAVRGAIADPREFGA